MSTPSTLGGPGRPAAGSAKVTIATYPDYDLAQQAVDQLADHDFPVERTTIIGTDLRLVERVMGRLTTVRAALAGAATGAWFGLLIGLLFGIFAVSGWLAVVLTAVLIGAVWGALFGAAAHAFTRGRRDFYSYRSIEAEQYAVTVDAALAEQAVRILEKQR